MSWRKLGLVFCPDGRDPLMKSHASHPVALHQEAGIYRIFFCSRDEENRSSIFSLLIDLERPLKPLEVRTEPHLSFGQRGSFDESGVTLGNILRVGHENWIYYLGWNLANTVPWRNAIGLALCSGGNEEFRRVSIGPVLDRNVNDPFTLSYPFVTLENQRWSMLYGSHLKWGDTKEDMHHILKSASSEDGILWKTNSDIFLSLDDENRIPVSRPWLEKSAQGNRLWYCYKEGPYRIGNSFSIDGLHWNREKDPIALSPGEWDGEMLCYPSVFFGLGKRYLLYCGNGYGKTGFGIAVWD